MTEKKFRTDKFESWVSSLNPTDWLNVCNQQVFVDTGKFRKRSVQLIPQRPKCGIVGYWSSGVVIIMEMGAVITTPGFNQPSIATTSSPMFPRRDRYIGLVKEVVV